MSSELGATIYEVNLDESINIFIICFTIYYIVHKAQSSGILRICHHDHIWSINRIQYGVVIQRVERKF